MTQMFEVTSTARRALIDYLCEATPANEAAMKKAMKALARDMDVTYERALRFLMIGDK